MDVVHPSMCSRAVIRVILYVNFFLFALFMTPITHHWVDRGFLALQSINLENFVGRSLEVWIVASTMTATVLFGLLIVWNRGAAQSVRSVRFEGILLFSWWIAVLATCAYGFMLGMGG